MCHKTGERTVTSGGVKGKGERYVLAVCSYLKFDLVEAAQNDQSLVQEALR
jgi:hypothetical protein